MDLNGINIDITTFPFPRGLLIWLEKNECQSCKDDIFSKAYKTENNMSKMTRKQKYTFSNMSKIRANCIGQKNSYNLLNIKQRESIIDVFCTFLGSYS